MNVRLLWSAGVAKKPRQSEGVQGLWNFEYPRLAREYAKCSGTGKFKAKKVRGLMCCASEPLSGEH